MMDKLGKMIRRDVEMLVWREGWSALMKSCRARGDFAALDNVAHPAQRLLVLCKYRGVPVKLKTPAWTRAQCQAALKRGPHKSCADHINFLEEEFVDMVKRGSGLSCPPQSLCPCLVSACLLLGWSPSTAASRAGWGTTYTWSHVNRESVPLFAGEVMQFGHALDRILRDILLANSSHEPVHLSKIKRQIL